MVISLNLIECKVHLYSYCILNGTFKLQINLITTKMITKLAVPWVPDTKQFSIKGNVDTTYEKQTEEEKASPTNPTGHYGRGNSKRQQHQAVDARKSNARHERRSKETTTPRREKHPDNGDADTGIHVLYIDLYTCASAFRGAEAAEVAHGGCGIRHHAAGYAAYPSVCSKINRY